LALYLILGKLTVLGLFLSLAVFQGLCLFAPIAGQPALAADLQSGAKVFKANCAMCHQGGRNTIVAEKTLEKATLEKYGKNSIAAITAQAKAGMNAMPAFKGRLTDAQIEDVATYILTQAENGWK